ncbi:MAG TPA: hypothetical protein VKU01_01620 [Bryobacteraceae bacterium]|nr:hypothetical protein [Bryobacteraceae bacterium]
MESTPPKMEPGPSKVIETIIGLLIPPACREHVLGDLAERYRSGPEYVWDALRAVPLIIASRIRRTAAPSLLLAQACAIYVAFLAAATRFADLSFLTENSGLMRLAIPTAAAVIALVLRDAYALPGPRRKESPAWDALMAVAFAFLLQALLRLVDPEMALPFRIMIAGGGLSLLLVSALRLAFDPVRHTIDDMETAGGPPKPSDDISRRSQELQRNTRRKNAVFLVGALFVTAMGCRAVADRAVIDRASGALMLVSAAYVMYRLFRKRLPRGQSLEAYKAQLQQQRDALHNISSWYGGPMLLALLAFALRFPLERSDPVIWMNIAPFTALAILWSFFLAIQGKRAARQIQEELDSLK